MVRSCPCARGRSVPGILSKSAKRSGQSSRDPAIEKIGQNLKYDAIVLRSAGIRLAGIAFDTIVASYLLDAGSRNHTLDELARRYLQHETISIKELIGSGKNQKRMDEVPVAQIAEYAAEDAIVPLWLKPILERKLAEAELETLFRNVEMPLVEAPRRTGVRGNSCGTLTALGN